MPASSPDELRLIRRIEVDPGDIDARKRLARLRYGRGDVVAAVQELLNCARLHLHLNHNREALRAAREALAYDRTNTDTLLVLAQIHARMPELDESERAALPAEPNVVELGPKQEVLDVDVVAEEPDDITVETDVLADVLEEYLPEPEVLPPRIPTPVRAESGARTALEDLRKPTPGASPPAGSPPRPSPAPTREGGRRLTTLDDLRRRSLPQSMGVPTPPPAPRSPRKHAETPALPPEAQGAAPPPAPTEAFSPVEPLATPDPSASGEARPKRIWKTPSLPPKKRRGRTDTVEVGPLGGVGGPAQRLDDASATDMGRPVVGRLTVPSPTSGVAAIDDVEPLPEPPLLAPEDAQLAIDSSAPKSPREHPVDVTLSRKVLGPADQFLTPEQLPELPFLRMVGHIGSRRFFDNLELVEYVDGHPVFRDAQPIDRLVVVYEGRLRAAADGQTPTVFQAGALVADLEFFARTDAGLPVRADGNVKLLELPRARAEALVRNDAGLHDAFEEHLRNRLIDDLLRRSPLFASLAPEQRHDVAARFFPLVVQPGEVVLKRGDISRRLFAVLTGALVVDSRGAERSFGRMPLESGDFFGFVSTILGRAVQVAVLATQPSTLLVLPEQEVYRLIASNKGIARAARREAVERGDVPISVHRVGGVGGLEVRRPPYE